MQGFMSSFSTPIQINYCNLESHWFYFVFDSFLNKIGCLRSPKESKLKSLKEMEHKFLRTEDHA